MEAAMTKVLLHGQLMFPSEYLAAIEFKSRDVTLTITKVELDDLKMRGGKSERKPVLYFAETKKKLVLNKTNAATIAELPGYGTAAEKWVSKRITLYPTTTQCGRATVDCIRVRDQVPRAKGSATVEAESEPVPTTKGLVEPPADATESDGFFDGLDLGPNADGMRH